ncbi:hypothetical protein MPTK1_1g24970 [Marchantia polymorpha subsp. ruderalis]|uniref:Uncharacterized protein n=2 Tax=Marchantia polymorpha TaxID=3197 RepID=A0AAF6AU15_MARPO|nr:hypothetical protein MARPO_0061s0028 [Marchantia polymorpha]BBM99935.1 hypothetical protein Mp_1g24970 [Marchantia polymorpha subsp. ruderalis]|eukprot:PTQ36751.1 hypothetical protein MARPO_0061s0028 [Marchantia polymorpha]
MQICVARPELGTNGLGLNESLFVLRPNARATVPIVSSEREIGATRPDRITQTAPCSVPLFSSADSCRVYATPASSVLGRGSRIDAIDHPPSFIRAANRASHPISLHTPPSAAALRRPSSPHSSDKLEAEKSFLAQAAS